MNGRAHRQGGDEVSLDGGEGVEAGLDDGGGGALALAGEGALGELNEEQVVGGLFAPEAVVEDADVVAAVGAEVSWQGLGQELQALAGPALDEGADQEAIDATVDDAALSDLRQEPLDVGVLLGVPELKATLDTEGGNSGEVAGLIAGELTKRDHELGVVGVFGHEGQRRHRRLVLAVGVVNHDLVEVGEAVRDPGR